MVNSLILNETSRCFLTHNCKNGADRYEFCGGKVKLHEDLVSAVIRENWEELGIGIRVKGVFGDYKTQTPEGSFFCRTYFAEIMNGTPEPREKDKMDWCGYLGYESLCRLNKRGVLVPNLVLALPKLRGIIC